MLFLARALSLALPLALSLALSRALSLALCRALRTADPQTEIVGEKTQSEDRGRKWQKEQKRMEEGEEERQHRSTHALSFASQGHDEIHLRNLVKASAPKGSERQGERE